MTTLVYLANTLRKPADSYSLKQEQLGKEVNERGSILHPRRSTATSRDTRCGPCTKATIAPGPLGGGENLSRVPSGPCTQPPPRVSPARRASQSQPSSDGFYGPPIVHLLNDIADRIHRPLDLQALPTIRLRLRFSCTSSLTTNTNGLHNVHATIPIPAPALVALAAGDPPSINRDNLN
jgi:hypothetical protein